MNESFVIKHKRYLVKLKKVSEKKSPPKGTINVTLANSFTNGHCSKLPLDQEMNISKIGCIMMISQLGGQSLGENSYY